LKKLGEAPKSSSSFKFFNKNKEKRYAIEEDGYLKLKSLYSGGFLVL
jgi:hypothetical protein